MVLAEDYTSRYLWQHLLCCNDPFVVTPACYFDAAGLDLVFPSTPRQGHTSTELDAIILWYLKMWKYWEMLSSHPLSFVKDFVIHFTKGCTARSTISQKLKLCSQVESDPGFPVQWKAKGPPPTFIAFITLVASSPAALWLLHSSSVSSALWSSTSWSLTSTITDYFKTELWKKILAHFSGSWF